MTQKRFLGLLPIFALLCLACAMTFDETTASGRTLRSGAVYVLTNQTENAVAAFERNADGSLTPAGTFLTGGSGNPVPQPGDPPADPLASQGALILSDNNHLLFAVNAGSNEISSFQVRPNGLLLVDKVASGGLRPISLTIHDNLLYVLNEGATPNITGFTVDKDGKLTPLANSTRPLTGGAGADPAQVSFNENGSLLVVTEKATSVIDTYVVAADGTANAPLGNPSAGMTPFGFAFDPRNHLIVSEALGGAPGASAASSYNADGTGTLSGISLSVGNTQTASCWTVITNGGEFAYISNTASGTITSYGIGAGGTLSLLNAIAANTGAMSAPIDMALDKGSRHLFVHLAGLQSVAVYEIAKDGSLTPVTMAGGLPFGAQGIAAR